MAKRTTLNTKDVVTATLGDMLDVLDTETDPALRAAAKADVDMLMEELSDLEAAGF